MFSSTLMVAVTVLPNISDGEIVLKSLKQFWHSRGENTFLNNERHSSRVNL
jgi:hypothetical protein